MKNNPENRRINSTFCLEYWLHRGFLISDFENFMKNMRLKTKSKISQDLFVLLHDVFPDHKIYYGEKEFGKYIPEVGYRRYDFVDLTSSLCIEFHGDYWHRTQEAKINDKIKKEFLQNLGFKYVEIMESDYRKDTDKIFNKLKDFIYENSN